MSYRSLGPKSDQISLEGEIFISPFRNQDRFKSSTHPWQLVKPCRIALICHTPPKGAVHWDLLCERNPRSELCATWRLDQPCYLGQGSTKATRLFDHRRHYLELEAEEVSDRVGNVKPEISGHITEVDDIDNPSCMVVQWSNGQQSKLVFLNQELRYEALIQADQTSEAR